MSDNNVAIIRGAYDAFGRGDIPGVIGILDEHVDWRSPQVLPHGGEFSGHDGVGSFFQGIGARWEDLAVHPTEFRNSGDEVVVLGTAEGHLRDAGEADYGFAHVFTLSGDRVTRFREYVDPGTALRG